MSTTRAPAGTQSVLRAIGLLKSLARARRPLELGELTARGGLTRTTTHRLLSALESQELVARDRQTGAYRLGPGVIALGASAMRADDVRTALRPHLRELAASTRETATFEILADGQMLIVDEVLGTQLLATTPSLGSSWALHATATGKALLAALPVPERRVLLRGRLRRFAPRTITAKRELDRELERVRDRGHALASEELLAGFSAAAAVVRDALGAPLGAIAVNAPTVRLRGTQLQRAGRLVMQHAADASAAMGYRA